MSCLGPEADLREEPTSRVRDLMALILASPEPSNYEESPLGDGTLRRDVAVWREKALALVKGGE